MRDAVIPKVSCFIIRPRDGRLLVFDHVDFPEAGTQVPAGTIEVGEEPAAAALREAEEETGFGGYRINRFVDRRTLPVIKGERREVHDRWFFVLDPPELPASWDHGEGHATDDSDWIAFRFFWIDPMVRPLPLDAGHAEVLELIMNPSEGAARTHLR